MESRETGDQVDRIARLIIDAEKRLKNRYPACAVSGEMRDSLDREWRIGFDQFTNEYKFAGSDKPKLWHVWAREKSRTAKKIPLQKLPLRERLILVASGVFTEVESTLRKSCKTVDADVEKALAALEEFNRG